MPSPPVVEDLQVLEDSVVGVRARRPVRLVREFDLERREEALGDRVVPAVAAPAHAHDDAVGVEHGAVVAARVLLRFNRSSRRVEPGAANPEHRTEQVDRERGLLSRDEGELHPCSLAKMVAFFRMSRSIRSVFTSRRNCVSSARSSVVSAPLALRPASTSAWTTQRRSAVSVRSSSRATVLTLFPLSRTTLIASALNSGENDRRRRFFPMAHSYRTFRAVRSVYETRASPPRPRATEKNYKVRNRAVEFRLGHLRSSESSFR